MTIHFKASDACQLSFRERQQLGFVSLNGNLVVNVKPTHPLLLNGEGQFTFLRQNRHTAAELLCTHQNLNFLESNSFW